MPAGRPHETAGNGSPRWMTAASRERGHRTRPTGRLTPLHTPDLERNHQLVTWFLSCSVGVTAKIASMAPRPSGSDALIDVKPSGELLIWLVQTPGGGGLCRIQLYHSQVSVGSASPVRR